jgi:membrane protein
MFKRIWKLISSTFIIWGNANASRMSAALAYFTMLSLAPLLMIAIAIAGYVFDSQAAQAEVIEQVQLVTTPEIANTVKGLIQNAVEPKTGLVAGTISLCVLVFGASGVFTQLSDTFDDIWKVPKEARSGLLYTVEKRLLGIGMVLIAGLSLLGALVLDSAMAYINQLVEGSYPRAVIWLNLADRSLSFLLMPFIFAVMFRFFPSAKIQWRDVWLAGILTALLVVASRSLIGLYLEFSTASEVYGAAGSLVVLLIWVYMTGLLIFFGAAFSHAWADTFGSRSDWGNGGQTCQGDSGEADSSTFGESGSAKPNKCPSESEQSIEEPTSSKKSSRNASETEISDGPNDPLVPKRRTTPPVEIKKLL